MVAHGDLPDVPDLEIVKSDEAETGEQFTIMGYPDVTLNDKKEQIPTKYNMYSATGDMILKKGECFGVNLLTSKGQSGGGLVKQSDG